MRLGLIYSFLNKQFLLNTHTHPHTHNFVLSATSLRLLVTALHLWINLYAACAVLRAGARSKGWRRRLGRKIHFSQRPHLQSCCRRQEAAHVPVSSQTPAAACLKPGHAASRRVGESPSGNICLLPGIFDSSIYLDSPRSQRQRFTSHLNSSGSQAQSQGAMLSRQLSSDLVCWIHCVGFSSHFLFHPCSLTPAPSYLLTLSMHLNARHLTTVGNSLWFFHRPGSIPPPPWLLILYSGLWVVASPPTLYLCLHLGQPLLAAFSVIMPPPSLPYSPLPPTPKPSRWSSCLAHFPQSFPSALPLTALHPPFWY